MIADAASENENLEKKTSNTESQFSFFLLPNSVLLYLSF